MIIYKFTARRVFEISKLQLSAMDSFERNALKYCNSHRHNLHDSAMILLGFIYVWDKYRLRHHIVGNCENGYLCRVQVISEHCNIFVHGCFGKWLILV